ncbi:MAG: hypothetical protein LBU60_04525 [Clostridiales bacterium]|jgi:hypothetical protein|nr:hypothetical protein [Clostridiales bacterium]
MKKFFYFITIIALLPFSSALMQKRQSKDIEIQYAQIVQSTFLCDIVEDEFVPITTLPQTYFVIITGDTVQDYYPVNYLDIDGFVDKNHLEIVDFEPLNKFAQGEIKIKPEIDGNVNLREHASRDSNIITPVDNSNLNMIYYGTVEGESIEQNNSWYYVRVKVNDEMHWGYMHSVNMLGQSIPDNVVIAVPPPDLGEEGSMDSAQPSQMSDTILYTIVAILCVPVLIIMLTLFKKKKK